MQKIKRLLDARKTRLTTLARMLADERAAYTRAAELSRNHYLLAEDFKRDLRAERIAHQKAADEIGFLYAELQTATRLPDDKLRHRVVQLGARREPEGRTYEGPEAQ